jgi:hypothetical protein
MTKQQMMMSRLAPLLGSHLWAGNINTRFTLWLEDIFMSPFLCRWRVFAVEETSWALEDVPCQNVLQGWSTTIWPGAPRYR